ncbi:MAG: CDP-alcohol phosphatidyltransferase family protein [Pseudomonadota bacterium]
MPERLAIPKNVTTILVYLRPPLVFCGMLCAVAVMWTRNPAFYTFGVLLLFISMSFDVVDGWFAARFHPYPTLARLADRIMDKVVYSIIFPLIAVGVMWRLVFITPNYTKTELLHAIFILFLCVTVLIRDNFAHFMRGFAIRQGQEPEAVELNRLRTMVAAPVGALLYAYAFYVPEGPPSQIYFWISWLSNIPLQGLFLIEIIFLIINFGSIAGYFRKYGTYCLEEVSLGDEVLRRHILTFFPNALTVMNAMMGLLSVFFAYQGRIREAYMLLIGAAMFDKLDGALARKLGLTAPPNPEKKPKKINMGNVLDDVSDAVSFCIAPAWIFYLCLSDATDPVLKDLPVSLIAWLYFLLGITRLIYFTLDKNPVPGFFKGLPTPAAALLGIAPLIMFGQAAAGAAEELRFWGIFCFAVMVLSSLLMNIYPIRYFHYGRFMSRHPVFVSLTFLVSLLLAFTPYFGHFALFCMLIYTFSPLWTWRISPEVAARETRNREV